MTDAGSELQRDGAAHRKERLLVLCKQKFVEEASNGFNEASVEFRLRTRWIHRTGAI